jgi:hypothetical protein
MMPSLDALSGDTLVRARDLSIQTPEDEKGDDTGFLGEDPRDIFKELFGDDDNDTPPMPENPPWCRKHFLPMSQTILPVLCESSVIIRRKVSSAFS